MGKNEDDDVVERQYFCNVCNTMHKIRLSKNLVKKYSNFPFTYVYLHGKLYNILTTLYLDANLNIRGAEQVKLDNTENIFDKEQMAKIINNLTEELRQMNEDYNDLLEKYKKLESKYNALKDRK
ncbi:MAG: hypothetical protein ACTSU2_17620 [Promethearchaeota archaeon]